VELSALAIDQTWREPIHLVQWFTDQLLGTEEMKESGALRCFHQVMGDISRVDGTTS
jgi:hypothetical protein